MIGGCTQHCLQCLPVLGGGAVAIDLVLRIINYGNRMPKALHYEFGSQHITFAFNVQLLQLSASAICIKFAVSILPSRSPSTVSPSARAICAVMSEPARLSIGIFTAVLCRLICRSDTTPRGVTLRRPAATAWVIAASVLDCR